MSEAEITPDGLAKKWFKIAFIGALVYVSIVFYFILTADVEPSDVKPAVVLHD